MATLNTNQKIQIRKALHSAYSTLSNTDTTVVINWTKTEIDAEISAIDAFLDSTGETSLNNQFSSGFRNAAKSSAADRAIILIAIIMRRRLASKPEHLQLLSLLLQEILT